MPISDEREDFWTFSVLTYPKARDEFLWLQDHAGLEVNILLLCLWAADKGRQLGGLEFSVVSKAIEDWNQHVVRPMRVMRRWMKPMATSCEIKYFRDTVAALELEGEKFAQGLMIDALATRQSRFCHDRVDPVELAVINLTTYLRACELDIGSESRRVITRMMTCVFQKSDRPAIVQMFERALNTI
tara:strand:+ start:141 stop:698 length:558 start_codon:yes stop_codon:yes gene_type:complete